MNNQEKTEMSEYELRQKEAQRLARALYLSRSAAGKSQEYMALELGVARKTIQNWEKGVSSPSMTQAKRWYEAIHMSPMPYLYEYVYPSMEGIKGSDSDQKIKESLIKVIDTLPPESIRQLLYLFYGDHGSSPRAVLNLLTAHLQTPMRDRVSHATLIEKDYDIAKKKGCLVGTTHIQPDIEFLKQAIEEGEKAFIENQTAYVM